MNRRQPITAWLFLVPALAFYLVFFALPIVQSFYVSLFRWSTISDSPERFVGLHHYARLVADGIFWQALYHNVVLLVLSLVIQLPIAVFLAALLSGRVFARSVFRTVYFMPMILPSVMIGLVWWQIYAPAFSQGLLVDLLDRLGFVGPPGGFLSGPQGIFQRLAGLLGVPTPPGGFWWDPSLPLIALVVTISWRYVGFHMVLFLAGIETISEDLYEAARIDGAGPWQIFRHVTLPLLAPVIRISAILSIVGSLKYFDLVWVMTGPNPQAAGTELMTTYMFREGIRKQDGGYGSALAVAGFLVSMAVVGVIAVARRRRAASAGEVQA